MKQAMFYALLKNSFFSITLGSIPYWIYKHNIDYFNQKKLTKATIDRIPLKGAFTGGAFLNDLREPMI